MSKLEFFLPGDVYRHVEMPREFEILGKKKFFPADFAYVLSRHIYFESSRDQT